MVQLYTKLTLGLFLIVFLSAPATAQVNTYFEHNPVWLVNSFCSAPAPCIKDEDYNYFINGDTLINGLTYVKLYRKGIYTLNWMSFPPPMPGCNGTYSYIDQNPFAFLRSFNKQMYIHHSGTEQLLYDFDLAIGDTLPLTYNNFEPLITVTAIDSLYTPYGYRKRFALTGNTWSTELIEGIGSDKGLLEAVSVVLECGFSLLCYSLNDTAWYPVTGPTCELNVGIAENTMAETISISPNPFNDKTTISWNQLMKVSRLVIYDVNGNVITEIEEPDNSGYELSRNNMTAGIYFYELQHEKTTSRGKLLVTN